MELLAATHAMEEELLTLLITNVFAQAETGMEHLALFAQEAKYGAPQHYLVSAPQETGTE
jgi:hypothetical protein